LKTRRDKLKYKIKIELGKQLPEYDNIISAVDMYEKNNIDAIQKLKKSKKVFMNNINGALKQTINAHGPITKQLIGSCSKRIYGALIINPNQEQNNKNKTKISIKSVVIGIVIGITITLLLGLMSCASL